jgi:hypothetical protein
MRLNVKAFALTCGLVWGLGLFFLTWWVIAFDGASGEVLFLGRIYRGYALSPAGSVVGALWAFLDGLAGGAVFAWLYNMLTGRVAPTPGPEERPAVPGK